MKKIKILIRFSTRIEYCKFKSQKSVAFSKIVGLIAATNPAGGLASISVLSRVSDLILKGNLSINRAS